MWWCCTANKYLCYVCTLFAGIKRSYFRDVLWKNGRFCLIPKQGSLSVLFLRFLSPTLSLAHADVRRCTKARTVETFRFLSTAVWFRGTASMKCLLNCRFFDTVIIQGYMEGRESPALSLSRVLPPSLSSCHICWLLLWVWDYNRQPHLVPQQFDVFTIKTVLFPFDWTHLKHLFVI